MATETMSAIDRLIKMQDLLKEVQAVFDGTLTDDLFVGELEDLRALAVGVVGRIDEALEVK